MLTTRSNNDKVAFSLVEANSGNLLGEAEVNIRVPQAFFLINIALVNIPDFLAKFDACAGADSVPFRRGGTKVQVDRSVPQILFVAARPRAFNFDVELGQRHAENVLSHVLQDV